MSAEGLTPRLMMAPIYCIADIDSKTIDIFLSRASSRSNTNFYLVEALHEARDKPQTCRPAQFPITPFRSPFLSWSLRQLLSHYQTNIPEHQGRFSSFSFVILDERSLRDATCRLVSIRTAEDEDFVTARADFYVAGEVLVPVEGMTVLLNEGMSEEWREDGGHGEILYTRERMIELMGPDFNMKDH